MISIQLQFFVEIIFYCDEPAFKNCYNVHILNLTCSFFKYGLASLDWLDFPRTQN